MKNPTRLPAVTFILCLLRLCAAPVAFAQQSTPACSPIAVPTSGQQLNILTAQQEEEFGEFLTEEIGERLRVIDDPELTARMQTIGDRLLQQLPNPGFPVRFYLSDLPTSNAFSLVGGKVYVTRKLVGFVHDEDELAAVVAHELGHVVTHQPALTFTRAFQAMGIQSVGDRADAYEKFNAFLERWPKIASARGPNELQYEILADLIALQAMARAGYDPNALAAVFERLSGAQAKTGNPFTDLFRTTPPDTKRLREMLQTEAQLTPACNQKLPPEATLGFLDWRKKVVSYVGTGHAESIPGLISRRNLSPPLQELFTWLRFSPDGKYILAQDTAEIDVLTRQPLALALRIDAPGALRATFTPDSQAVVFSTPGLRVERWNLSDHQSVANEVTVEGGCGESKLSPDGKILACMNFRPSRANWDLLLVDVSTDEIIAKKADFLHPMNMMYWGVFELTTILAGPRTPMDFSADSRYFVAHSRSDETFAFDLSSQQPIPLNRTLKDLTSSAFAFLGPDRLVGFAGDRGQKSAIAKFPSGDLVQMVQLGTATPYAVGHGSYILVYPVAKAPVGVLDLSTEKIIFGSMNPALDIYDDTFVAETASGQIGLIKVASTRAYAELKVPHSRLSPPRTVGVSEDLKWLALSAARSGGVWNLYSGGMVDSLAGFRGAHFEGLSLLYVEFAAFEETPASVTRIDLGTRADQMAVRLDKPFPKQWGPFLVKLHPVKNPGFDASPSSLQDARDEEDHSQSSLMFNVVEMLLASQKDWQLEVSDVKNGSQLWSRHFPKDAPKMNDDFQGKTITLIWGANAPGARIDAQLDPEFARRFSDVRGEDEFVEFVDAKTGKAIAALRVDTQDKSFVVSSAYLAGESAIVRDNLNRLLIYSTKDGARKAILFGLLRAISPDGRYLCYENSVGREIIYDLHTLAEIGEQDYSQPVAFARFSGDSRDLLVVTTDQVAYISRVPTP